MTQSKEEKAKSFLGHSQTGKKGKRTRKVWELEEQLSTQSAILRKMNTGGVSASDIELHLKEIKRLKHQVREKDEDIKALTQALKRPGSPIWISIKDDIGSMTSDREILDDMSEFNLEAVQMQKITEHNALFAAEQEKGVNEDLLQYMHLVTMGLESKIGKK